MRMLRAGIGTLFLLFTACSSYGGGSDIEGRDTGVIVPAIRLRFDFTRADDPEPVSTPTTEGDKATTETGKATTETAKSEPIRPRSRGRRIFGLEFAMAGTTGDFDMSGGGTFGGTVFPSSMPIDVDYRVVEASIAVRGGVQRRKFRFEGIGGFVINDINIDLHSGGVSDSRDSTRFGPMIGAEIGFSPFKVFEIYGRTTHALLLADATSSRQELGLRATIDENFDFMVSYQWWRHRTERLYNDGDVDLRNEGLLIGAEIVF